MVNDPRKRPSSTHGRLWTDGREEDEGQPWLAPRNPIVPRAPLRPPEEPEDDPRDNRRFFRNALLAALAIFALIGAGFLTNGIFFDGDDGPSTAVLPADPGAAPADRFSRTVRSIYRTTNRSVVAIRVSNGASTASGTGFLIDGGTGAGTIVTNAHVIGNADAAQVRLDDNTSSIDARVVGTDPSTDLAVLEVDADDVAGRPALALADSDGVQVGDLAVAIGYPFSGNRSLTTGVVSGVGRTISAPNRFSISEAIQTDAAINPGNSGGPLLDSAGRVIGVNSQIATTSGGNVGIGFAVPSNTVREVVPRLERNGTIERAYLGVESSPPVAGPGALVQNVSPSGPADAGGLREGDVIRRIGGRDVQAPDDVGAAIDNAKPGDTVEVEVDRGGSTQTLTVKLGTRPASVPGSGGTP